MSTLNKSDLPRKTPPGDPEAWRSMPEAEALAHLVALDVARRTSEGRAGADELHLTGLRNRSRLRAWRRENGICPKCGTAIPADEPEYKHCPKCRAVFRDRENRRNANLTEPQRLARNERSRQRFHRIVHGQAAPPKVVTPKVTPVVTPPPVVTHKTGSGAKRDRAKYMRAYRAKKARGA